MGIWGNISKRADGSALRKEEQVSTPIVPPANPTPSPPPPSPASQPPATKERLKTSEIIVLIVSALLSLMGATLMLILGYLSAPAAFIGWFPFLFFTLTPIGMALFTDEPYDF